MNVVAPSGVVTFLFTDIEGSTRRWEADADGMRAALAAHDALLRETVEAHGGWLFKHTGDGVCAVFESPRSAVEAAVTAQRTLELPVRMGIATGEAELRGEDYFGAVLNRAARVMSAGHGGQILIDGATAELLSSVELRDLGPRRLRDIAKPVTVFQVLADELRSDFPPLKTLDSTPGNLRPATTSFVGREAEIADVQTALKAHRVVTLTGPGGVGKTRLALEVAARLAHEFPDGVWVIELAPVGDPAAIPGALAAVLGITQQPGMTLADSVAAALEGRSRLLVFDNCEHVLDAAAEMIEKILARSTTVSILATSREGLQASDEQLWPVPSLDVQTGANSAAAALFVERAEAVAHGVSLADDGAAVVEICRRLDGIPLAIELAASRLVSMTVTEVRDRLGDRFRLLVGSRRGIGRHQTLRQAVQWSYDLLGDTEKELLQRCSVFAGGFDLAAACAVSGSADEFEVLDLLDALVRKSLLVADWSSERTRYSMLETIRQFAEDQLAQAGQADQVRSTHARYFAGREDDVLALWDSPRQRDAYTWFTVELANLRSAFRWAADNGDLDSAAGIAFYAALFGLWRNQHEPVGWSEELIEPAKAVDHRRLAQLYTMASQCYATGRVDDAIGYANSGRLAVESGRYAEVPFELDAFAAGALSAKGHPEQWVEWCRNIIARRPGTHIVPRGCLVLALRFTGAVNEAIAACEGLVADAEATENPLLICLALLSYSSAHRDVDPSSAYDSYRRGLALAQESGNRQHETHYAVGLSRLAITQGDPLDAFDFLTLSIRNGHDAGSIFYLLSPLAVLAVFLDRLEHYEPAATLCGFAANTFTRVGVVEIDSTVSHLREVLGDEVYESLAGVGQRMSNTEMVNYAFDQIDRARAELSPEGAPQ